jgi:hypothetical protein
MTNELFVVAPLVVFRVEKTMQTKVFCPRVSWNPAYGAHMDEQHSTQAANNVTRSQVVPNMFVPASSVTETSNNFELRGFLLLVAICNKN